MKVRDLFTVDPGTCGPDDNIAVAAQVMWEKDCGSVPVIDIRRRVVGMITDRDITIAAMTKNRPAGDIHVREVMSGRVYSCRLENDIREALKIMVIGRVRRLPVVDADNVLLGVLSISDLVRRIGQEGVSAVEVLDAFRAICTPHRLIPARSPEPEPAGRKT